MDSLSVIYYWGIIVIMQEDKHNDISGRNIVIRLINGSLRGCDFTLTTGRTLFLVCNTGELEQQHKGTITPDNTIYIPCDVASHNFEIFVPEDHDKHLVLRELHPDDIFEKQIDANKIYTIGQQKICWRNEADSFDNDLLMDDAHLQSNDEDNLNDSVVIINDKMQWWKLVAALVIICCVSAAGYSYLNGTKRQVTSVSDFLDNMAGDYSVIYGKDKIIYIISASESAAEWATQSMIRKPPPYSTKILTMENEEQRINKWIESNWPQVKLHRVRLDTPEHPIIEVSAERTKLTSIEMNKFTESVTRSINYATSVSVSKVSDQSIRSLAIDGLEKLSISFTEVKNTNSITLVIRGAIDDGEFERLKKFITDYSQIWKGEYVQFAMEIKDDWLKGKSYKYGDRGYVKLSPGHWYFPRNVKKEL